MRPGDPIGAVVYDAVLAALQDGAPRTPERLPLADVAAHGAPSARWVVDQARAGRITIRGPRGARYVRAAELASLLGETTIKRRSTHAAVDSAVASDDMHDVVSELAKKRSRAAE